MSKEKFTFQVEQIRFSKDGFHIAVTTRGDSVKGKFAAKEGHCYQAEGKWVNHAQFGPQFEIEAASSIRMTDAAALGRFLTMRMRGTGVGEVVIGALVEACKTDGLDLEALLDKSDIATLVSCVGNRNAKKMETLLEHWPKIKPAADLISPLLGYGLSEALAETLVSLFGNSALQRVEDKPYELMLMVEGISFLSADKIAMKVGRTSKTDDVRLRAALATGLRDATSRGDLGVRRSQLIKVTMPLVNEAVMENGRRILVPGVEPAVPEAMLEEMLDRMIKGDPSAKNCRFSSSLVEKPDEKGQVAVWYRPLLDAEEAIVRRIKALNAPPRTDLIPMVDDFAKKLGVEYAPEQHQAIVNALTYPISIITGGPGMGKSFILKGILSAFAFASIPGEFAAPTGSAAKRITQATGHAASTCHSLIGFNGIDAAANELSPLAAKYLVVDEMSMTDVELFAKVLCAIQNGCRVILVGDYDQLASVGPGQVLRDLIRSNVIPVTRLTRGYRFSGGIAEAATEVNAGRLPDNSEDGQFEFVETETPGEAVITEYRNLIAKGVNIEDILVLSPIHMTEAGCVAINKAVQALVNSTNATNPSSVRLRRDSGDIFVNDRVQQVKNDRETGLVNGDVGWLDDITPSGMVQLTLDDTPKPYNLESRKTVNLRLAYARTVHKSQGAEAPYVLMLLPRTAAFMLRRALVYTGLTRGKQQVKVFGARATLAQAVHRGEPPEGSRRTLLASRLREELPALPIAATAAAAKASSFDSMLLGTEALADEI